MDMLASFNENDEVIQYSEPNIIFIVDETSFGKGTLYVAESKLYWKNGTNNQVVSVDYKSMCVFGTCNHPTVHEKPCLQIIVDFTYKPSDNVPCTNGQNSHQNGEDHNAEDDSEENDGVAENENEDEDEGQMNSKIKLVPDNSECLTEVYEAFTRVQPLHNVVDMDSEDENEDFYYNENDEFEDYDEDDGSEQNILLN